MHVAAHARVRLNLIAIIASGARRLWSGPQLERAAQATPLPEGTAREFPCWHHDMFQMTAPWTV